MTARTIATGIGAAALLRAHQGERFAWHDLFTEWVWDPVLVVPLIDQKFYPRYRLGHRRWPICISHRMSVVKFSTDFPFLLLYL